jgi:hypothetical protein
MSKINDDIKHQDNNNEGNKGNNDNKRTNNNNNSSKTRRKLLLTRNGTLRNWSSLSNIDCYVTRLDAPFELSHLH